jgi:hypothetical protein
MTMAFELREGQGSLFRNENRTGDNQPNARGDALIGGVVYEISAWTKEGKKGKFQSLSIKPKQQREHGERRNPSGGYPDDDDGGPIPF